MIDKNEIRKSLELYYTADDMEDVSRARHTIEVYCIDWLRALLEEIERLREANKQLTEERDEYRKTLEWYASDYAQNINDEAPIIRLEYPEYAQTYYEMDNGNRARQVLQARKGGGEG